MHSKPRRLLRSALLLAFASACGGSTASDVPPASAPSPSPAHPTAPAPGPKGPRGPIDPSQTGTIQGVVRFEGEAPPRKPLSISGSGGCPDHVTPPLSEDVIVADGKLANVFVWIKDGLAGWDIPPAPAANLTMDQAGCVYVPHVAGMRAGQTLLVHNSDTTNHNVNIRAIANEALNRVQPPSGQPVEWKPTKKEIAVSFECNVHPWMRSYVCVVEHPWFAVTGADGAFSLQGVPPGDYVLEAWHEKYGKKTAKVSVAPGGNTPATLTFQSTDKSR